MLSVVSVTGEWVVEIDGITYTFYYSEAKPTAGLTLDGCSSQEKEYEIGNLVFSVTKEDYPHLESGCRYLLHIKQI